MEKVYIITAGSYSDYGIECCFSTRAKAEEYLKFIIETKGIGSDYYGAPRIEEYPLNASPKIERVFFVELASPLLDSEIENEEIEIWYVDHMQHEVVEEETYIDYKNAIRIARAMNPNKSIEDEENRIKKVAYDILKKVVYLMKVENMSIPDINKYLGNKEED